ncbi:Uncharacterised protein [Streptococcus pneumoniae]|nr:Uncharacterised protein [Streptococcus pneumoniae]VKQ76649.1 Uncharacterised protein [Streptococcus pneumoniae]VMK51941.1 Uncharacterised protein [Streptococcus pneumoniae]VRE01041.1 Uncharacterised protein [Streptococcus pneumoniae]VSG88608.1 Uncharacterised protein [Streptococcus pneumoniae]
MRSIPSGLNAASKPFLKGSNNPLSLSPRPSKMLLNLLSMSVNSTSGKMSLKGPPPPPFPLPPLPPPPEPPASSSFGFCKMLISSNPKRPSNSLAAFLAFLAESPRLSASPPAESPASSTASARSPAPPAASFMALPMSPTAPPTPSFTVAFLLNIKAINSASLAVTFFKTIAKEFKTGIMALIIGNIELPRFNAASFISDLNRLIRPFTELDKVSPYLAVACSRIAIRRICCWVW